VCLLPAVAHALPSTPSISIVRARRLDSHYNNTISSVQNPKNLCRTRETQVDLPCTTLSSRRNRSNGSIFPLHVIPLAKKPGPLAPKRHAMTRHSTSDIQTFATPGLPGQLLRRPHRLIIASQDREKPARAIPGPHRSPSQSKLIIIDGSPRKRSKAWPLGPRSNAISNRSRTRRRVGRSRQP
jgi:hypothetical protein